VARLQSPIGELAGEFVLVRLTNMRGVNLDVFDFDYDLTWAGFFLSPDQEIYGRYGGRDASSPQSRLSLGGLRYAMTQALKAHREASPIGNSKSETRNPKTEVSRAASGVELGHSISETETATSRPRTVDQYPGAERRPAASCIHCHQVYDFRREMLQKQGKWRLDELWVYPLPDNVGIRLDVDEGDRVRDVMEDSPASRAGLRRGDRLRSVNHVPIASLADVQYGLHRAGAEGEIPISWRHGDQPMSARLSVGKEWRKTDISWRWSLRGLEPTPWVQGEDLTAEEKAKLGLPEHQLAFYLSAFLSPVARHAGLGANDIILGVDDKRLEMTAQQFQAYIRLNYKVGDRITYNILREGRRLPIPLTLTARPAS
jgi:hypothetical protein